MSAPSTPEAHPGGILFKFPAELRLKIYECMFQPVEIDIFQFRNNLIKEPKWDLVAGQHVAILATCRAIYKEAQPVLYDNTRFIVHCSWHPYVGPQSASEAVRDKYSGMVWAQRPSLSDTDTDTDSDTSMSDGSDESDYAIVEWKKITHLQQARRLMVNINLDGQYEGEEDAWFQDISSACDLKRLHILLFDGGKGTVATAQEDLDLIMAKLEVLECKGTITAMVFPSDGAARLSLDSYHRMLERVGGVHTTPALHAKLMARLSSERHKVQQKLDRQRTRLISKSSELVDIQSGNTHWSEQQDLRARVKVLLKRLKSIFKSVSELEDKVISSVEDIRGLERQGKAFLNEREALLTAA